MNDTSTTLEKRKVSGRPQNNQVRPREHLTQKEAESLIEAAGKSGRHRHRDRTILLLMYSHGLRAGEVSTLKRSQIDLDQGLLHVSRLKNGVPSTHPLRGMEIRALRKLFKDLRDGQFVFTSERGAPLTVSAIQKIVKRAGEKSGFDFPVHPHQLRHACGFKLANDGHDTRAIQLYLGHKNITHTVRYTELSPDRFNSFWKD